jgi:ParB family transcriptional regulator, chromosome partitioning protein
MEKRPALGKGLSALIPDASDVLTTPRAWLEVDIDLLEPNDLQPRGPIDAARLEDLAKSIRANGIVQPIIVRPLEQPPTGQARRYQIIAGERRWRAAQLAQLPRVPVVVKDLQGTDRRQQLEMALIENIQREDLNPMEEAAAYQRLVNDFRLRQEDVSERVGKDRATIANYLRLLKLPEEVRGNVASGALSMGHARALVALPSDADQRRVAREVVARTLSVRETEALVKIELRRSESPASPPTSKPKNDVHTRAAEEQLRLALGTPVSIQRRGKGGTVSITFTNENELQRIYEYLTEDRRKKNEEGK